MLKKLLIALWVALLAACQTPNTNSEPQPEKPVINSQGPVTIEGNCDQRAPDGYRDKITISVKDNIVSVLKWRAAPRGGACQFDLKNFTQISKSPNADLQSKKDKKCHIYVWQDVHHVTVALYGCKKICRLNDKILPVLLQPQTGACKPAGHDNDIAK